jgi:hypothetical protein
MLVASTEATNRLSPAAPSAVSYGARNPTVMSSTTATP